MWRRRLIVKVDPHLANDRGQGAHLACLNFAIVTGAQGFGLSKVHVGPQHLRGSDLLQEEFASRLVFLNHFVRSRKGGRLGGSRPDFLTPKL